MALVLTLMVLIALTGLLSGALVRVLHDGVARSVLLGQTNGPGSAPTATTAAMPSITPTITPTVADTPDQFVLTVAPSMRTIAPGQHLTITVHAYTPDTHAPVSGLPCELRSPATGASLLTVWPAPAMTDASGAASWVVTVPKEAPGAYEVEAYSSTSAWSFRSDTTVQVSAG